MFKTYLFAGIIGYVALGCSLLAGGQRSSSQGPTAAAPQVHEAQAPDPSDFVEAEPLLADAAPRWGKQHGTPPPTLLRAYVQGDRWGMNRTGAGVITDRGTKSQVFYKGGESGRCYRALCNLKQEEQNGAWGKPYLQCFNEYTILVTCESIDALRPGVALAL